MDLSRSLIMVSALALTACDGGGARGAEQPPVGTSASASGSGSSSGESGADSATFDPEESSSSGTTFEPSTGGVDPVFDPAFVEQRVDALLAAGVPGLAVAVVFDGEVVYAQGHGVAGPDAGPVDASTLFNLGSVAKSATAMTLVEQAAAGSFDLQDPVSAHVPSFGVAGPYSAQSVTVQHLLTQSAGLGDWETEPFASAATLADSFALNINQPLWAEPGAVFNYSNRNFELAGLVAATVEGTSFSEAVRSRVLDPLGMSGATMDGALAQSRPHAQGLSGSQWLGPSDYIGERYEPVAGLWAGADDLGAYLQGLLAHPSMAEPHKPTHWYYGGNYGYGLFVDAGSDPIVVGHGGSTGGYLADVQLVPERGFGVALVVNTDETSPGEATYAILEHYAGPFGFVGSGLPQVDESAIPGMYDDAWQLGTIEVRSDGGGGLELNLIDSGTVVPLDQPYPGAWFFIDPTSGYDVGVTFWPGADGVPTHLVSRRGVATRTSG